MSLNERLASLVALVTLGLGLSLAMNPPVVWGFLALLIVTTCVGTSQALRGDRARSKVDLPLTVLVLPSLIVLGSFLFLRLPVFAHGVAAAGGLLTAALLLGLALYAEYLTARRDHPRSARGRLVLNLISYAIAFALYTAIFAPKVRSIFSATAILLTSALIAAELFRDVGEARTRWLYVAIVGLILGEVTWALNYWVLGALTGGAILLLVFYAVTGIIRARLEGVFGPRILTEHLAVVGLGLVAVIAGGLWLR